MSEKQARTEEEKKLITAQRKAGVKQAWTKEKERVAQGEGSRDWTPEQQDEIMKDGGVKGYRGHHMKSVSTYPEHAANPENIQFLTQDEHIQGAHQGSTHNQTNGYYNPETGQMTDFGRKAPTPVESHALSEPRYENGGSIQKNQSASAFNESSKGSGQASGGSSGFNASAKGQSSQSSSSSSLKSTGVSR